MKKFITIVISFLLATACAISMTACAPNDSAITPVESAVYDANKKQLVVATNAAFPPFEYKMGNKFAGIDMEIAKGFADYLGWEIVIMDMDFDAVVTSVGKNGVDIAMAGLTVNESRKQSVNFTNSYYNASQVVIVRDGDTSLNGLTTAAQIDAVLNQAGNKIGVQSGTTGEFYVTGDVEWGFDGLTNATCNPYPNAALAVTDLKNGNIDYVVVDEAPAKNIAEAVGGVKVITIPLTVEEYAFGVDKNQPDLLAKANEYLALIKSNGTYEKIAQKYFSNTLESND